MLLNEWAVLLPGSSKGKLPKQLNFATKMPSIWCVFLRHGRYDDTLASLHHKVTEKQLRVVKRQCRDLLRMLRERMWHFWPHTRRVPGHYWPGTQANYVSFREVLIFYYSLLNLFYVSIPYFLGCTLYSWWKSFWFCIIHKRILTESKKNLQFNMQWCKWVVHISI